ncbi:hypothetical protein HN873_010933 [Arachis hypogaea]
MRLLGHPPRRCLERRRLAIILPCPWCLLMLLRTRHKFILWYTCRTLGVQNHKGLLPKMAAPVEVRRGDSEVASLHHSVVLR